MELWQALVFRSLQESDLKDMLPGGGRGIADSELGLGANVRNLLGQGLSFTESPDMGYYRFKNSPDPIKMLNAKACSVGTSTKERLVPALAL